MSAKPFSRKESIRVVPLHQPKLEAGLEELGKISSHKVAAPPQLSYRGGPLLANVEIFTIFLGADWANDPLKTLSTQINNFFTNILQSSLIDQLTEYNTQNFTIGKGKLTGTTTIVKGAPKNSITDSQIQSRLKKWISGPSFQQPNQNTLYFIFLENGVTVSMGGSKSCSSFCGYHNATGTNIFYAVMPYPGCQGCLGGLTLFNAITATTSHELCEAITDPIPGSGWYDDNNGEIGDICAWQFKMIGNYTIQLEWSNKQDKCI